MDESWIYLAVTETLSGEPARHCHVSVETPPPEKFSVAALARNSWRHFRSESDDTAQYTWCKQLSPLASMVGGLHPSDYQAWLVRFRNIFRVAWKNR